MELEDKPSSLGDCLKLLRGERDEQRLAGLLLATKFSKGDDLSSLRTIYDAVGVRFLDRLLWTGLKRGTSGVDEIGDAYLQLPVTLLAAFCCVHDIASSQEMVSKIPFVLEILSKEDGSPVLEEFFEFLYLVISANEDGVTTFFENEGAKVLVPQISTLPQAERRYEVSLDEPTYINLLKALALWTESQKNLSVKMMASSICSLILECTSEEVLLSSFSQTELNLLSRLIVMGLVSFELDESIEAMAEGENDLRDLVKSGVFY